jgi:hypothetical protein
MFNYPSISKFIPVISSVAAAKIATCYDFKVWANYDLIYTEPYLVANIIFNIYHLVAALCRFKQDNFRSKMEYMRTLLISFYYVD